MDPDRNGSDSPLGLIGIGHFRTSPWLVVMDGAVDGEGGGGIHVIKTAVLGASLSRSQREEAKRALSRYANNLNLNTNMYI